MHSVFLFHAIPAGMDMGIVNAGALALYDDIEPSLREAVEDVVLARRTDATERLLAEAERHRPKKGEVKVEELAWRDAPVDTRIAHALVHGIDRKEAIDFGRTFRQNTIVYCQGARPELIVTDPTCDDIGKTFQGHWRVRS